LYRKNQLNIYLLIAVIIVIALVVFIYNYTTILNEYNSYKERTYNQNMKILFNLINELSTRYDWIIIRLENMSIIGGDPVYSRTDREIILVSSMDADFISGLASDVALNNDLHELSNALSNIQLASHMIHQKMLVNEKQTCIVLLNDKDLLKSIINDLNTLWKQYRNFTTSGSIDENEVKRISYELLKTSDKLVDDLDKIPAIVK